MKKGSILSLGTYSNSKFLTYSEDYKFIKDCGFEPLADFKQTYIKTDNLSNRNELDWGANILSYRMPFKILNNPLFIQSVNLVYYKI